MHQRIQRFYKLSERNSERTVNPALGKVLIPKESPIKNFSDNQVKVTAFLADESLKLEYASTLYVRFELGQGLHIYGTPLPDGFISTQVELVENAGIRAG